MQTFLSGHRQKKQPTTSHYFSIWQTAIHRFGSSIPLSPHNLAFPLSGQARLRDIKKMKLMLLSTTTLLVLATLHSVEGEICDLVD